MTYSEGDEKGYYNAVLSSNDCVNTFENMVAEHP